PHTAVFHAMRPLATSHDYTISPAMRHTNLALGLFYCSQMTVLEGCPGGKERRADRVTGARRCGKDSIPGVDPDIVPRVAALRTGAMRLLPALRQACTRPADHKQPIMSVVPFIPHTQEEGLLRPPPEPPPGVSAALPRRKTSSRSASSCPSCGSVFSSAV
ncbi:hypothetical protein TcCL_NonESM08105, partial [Trypanosoma cruzi]